MANKSPDSVQSGVNTNGDYELQIVISTIDNVGVKQPGTDVIMGTQKKRTRLDLGKIAVWIHYPDGFRGKI